MMKRFRTATVILAALYLAGCSSSTSIADINRDPSRFTGKEITISGQAMNAFGAFGNGVFQVDDGTGNIWVFSQESGLPSNGARVSVTGQVEQGFSFGGKTYGLIFRQTKASQ